MSPYAKKKFIWPNIIFFALTFIFGALWAPFHILRHGLTAPEIVLFTFYWAVTGLSITVGYHRLFAHRTFDSRRVLDFLILFFGAAAFEQSALAWSSQHRDHHRFVDTDQDPYSIQKGFWYAHIGWILFWEHKMNYDNAKDLQKNSLLMHQHRYYLGWAVFSGIVLPVLIGALYGKAWEAFLVSVCLRLVFVHHSTFSINSICHTFGKATYDIHATAKDHWLVALLTNGEGYHNFHHRFPGDYRNGIRWYHWDPSKWLIWLCSKIGLAHSLKSISQFEILRAKLDAQREGAAIKIRFCDKMQHDLETLKKQLEIRYQDILSSLSRWEELSANYNRFVKSTGKSQGEREAFSQLQRRLLQAQLDFQKAYEDWKLQTQQHLFEMKAA